jgi:hypothetical protein
MNVSLLHQLLTSHEVSIADGIVVVIAVAADEVLSFFKSRV